MGMEMTSMLVPGVVDLIKLANSIRGSGYAGT
jgi:hypothetical protein